MLIFAEILTLKITLFIDSHFLRVWVNLRISSCQDFVFQALERKL